MTTRGVPRSSGWRSGWRLAKYYPTRYVLGGTLWALVQFLPLIPGVLLKEMFDRLAPGRAAGGSALSVLAVLAAAELARNIVFWSAMVSWPRWFGSVSAWVRSNLLSAVLRGSGPANARLPGSAGEAIGRFRDDVDDLVWLTDGWVDLAGAVVLGVVGFAVLVAIDPPLALVIVSPLFAVLFVTRFLTSRIRQSHRGLRLSGAAVTSFIADAFSNVQALKTSGAEARALTHFHELNNSRGAAAVRAQLAQSLNQNVSAATADISTGIVLLLAASAMRRGAFTVGDLALFTSYASTLTALPRRTGVTLARARTAGVATERLVRLVPESGEDAIFAPGPVYLTSPPPPPEPVPSRPDGDALVRLTVRGLTASPVVGRRGIVEVDLDIQAGEFIVVTGPVGAGKSTLLRALLGLTAAEGGLICWNDKPVVDPGLELTPPRVAYVAQVPRLFSASLSENITLGWPAAAGDMTEALRLASLDTDIDEMQDGLATLVGPRGMRLSGGQAQRAAAARALVRRPDLLVVDDLSSALDPQTETSLWAALADLPSARLAVSHRPAVLERADRVVVLEHGRVTHSGTWPG